MNPSIVAFSSAQLILFVPYIDIELILDCNASVITNVCLSRLHLSQVLFVYRKRPLDDHKWYLEYPNEKQSLNFNRFDLFYFLDFTNNINVETEICKNFPVSLVCQFLHPYDLLFWVNLIRKTLAYNCKNS